MIELFLIPINNLHIYNPKIISYNVHEISPTFMGIFLNIAHIDKVPGPLGHRISLHPVRVLVGPNNRSIAEPSPMTWLVKAP